MPGTPSGGRKKLDKVTQEKVTQTKEEKEKERKEQHADRMVDMKERDKRIKRDAWKEDEEFSLFYKRV